jgi:SAM-dependent methyltransferase
MKFTKTEYEELKVPANHRYATVFSFDRRLGDWVNFKKNMSLPFHRWFYYKQGFSCNLVDFVKKRYFPFQTCLRVFDPFCGVGTVPLWASENGHIGIGSDVSPLSIFISETKAIRKINISHTMECARNIIKNDNRTKTVDFEKIPFYFEKGFQRNTLKKMLQLLDDIRSIEDINTQKVILLALMKAAYDVSLTKKDGGFLRYIEKPRYTSIGDRVVYHLNDMLLDFREHISSFTGQDSNTTLVRPKFNLMDARSLSFDEEPFDLIVTSPPYLNRNDYTRIYAIEYGLLGLSDLELKNLRKKTIKSHVEADFEKSSDMKSTIFDVAYEKLGKAKLTNIGIPEMVFGYFNDMACSLRELRKYTKQGGVISFVVGNSRFSGIHFETDAIIAEIAENLGFTLKEIIVTKLRGSSAQQLHNYGDLQLRESVVNLTK